MDGWLVVKYLWRKLQLQFYRMLIQKWNSVNSINIQLPISLVYLLCAHGSLSTVMCSWTCVLQGYYWSIWLPKPELTSMTEHLISESPGASEYQKKDVCITLSNCELSASISVQIKTGLFGTGIWQISCNILPVLLFYVLMECTFQTPFRTNQKLFLHIKQYNIWYQSSIFSEV